MRWLLLLCLTGCAHVGPYWELGISRQLDTRTDYWVQTYQDWQCSRNLKADGEAGIVSRNLRFPVRLGLRHQSWVLCGTPFNHDPEIYVNDIRLSIRSE